jgi:hypothetical protein
MRHLSLACPHCRTERIGFVPRNFIEYRHGEEITIIFLQCLGCGGGLLAYVDMDHRHVDQWLNGLYGNAPKILETYPEYERKNSPADVPDNVRNAFLSGLDNLGRPNGANAAAMMFRRSIELAIKNQSQMGRAT